MGRKYRLRGVSALVASRSNECGPVVGEQGRWRRTHGLSPTHSAPVELNSFFQIGNFLLKQLEKIGMRGRRKCPVGGELTRQ